MAPKLSTQNFVPIKEVRDGVIVLNDGSLRGAILASSINFALKSDDERTSVLYQFQNFLNSLDFSVQIAIQSRRLDIRPYLALIAEKEQAQVNDLLKVQIQEYMQFVKRFTDDTSIMTKQFFVIVPYAGTGLPSARGIGNLLGKKQQLNEESKRATFEENRTQLEQRMSIVEQGLSRSGIRVARLGTEEVTELLYRVFNPGESEKPTQQKT